MRTEKHHTMGEIAAMGKHNERTRDTPNANPKRLADNVRPVGGLSPVPPFVAASAAPRHRMGA